ncbi:hypothetical protein MINS_03880 [Mycolicibacterium insubricum]|nr:hypothetical protein MINS_03880 [Mycolicibacterium insubricum]
MPQSMKDAVLDQLPGYRAAEHRENRLKKELPALAAAGIPVSLRYLDVVRERLDGDGPLDLRQMCADYGNEYTAQLGRHEFHQMLATELTDLHHQKATLLANHADVALDFLRGQLDQLMAAVRDNRERIAGQPASADAALAAGKNAVADYQLVQGLIGRYVEIRAEHRRYAAGNRGAGGGVGAFGRPFDTVGEVARFLEVVPYWQQRRGTTPARNSTEPAIRAWFNASHAGAMQVDSYGNSSMNAVPANQWLLTVADNDPWLPDGDTIQRAYDFADQLFAPGRSYNRRTEIEMFWSHVANLAELGVTTDLPEPASA